MAKPYKITTQIVLLTPLYVWQYRINCQFLKTIKNKKNDQNRTFATK
jgi:competence CoiA-like predicted nuclease